MVKEIRVSKKLNIPTRRIIIDGVSYTIRPSFVMHYHMALPNNVEKALFLRKFDVPFWALSYLFGKDQTYWYKISLCKEKIYYEKIGCISR